MFVKKIISSKAIQNTTQPFLLVGIAFFLLFTLSGCLGVSSARIPVPAFAPKEGNITNNWQLELSNYQESFFFLNQFKWLNNEAFCAHSSESVVIYSLTNGQMLFEHFVQPEAPLVLSNCRVIDKILYIAVIDRQNNLSLYSLDTLLSDPPLELLWQINLPNRYLYPPHLTGSADIIITDNQSITAKYARLDGERDWFYLPAIEPRFRIRVPYQITSDEQAVYLGLSRGLMVVLNVDNGELIWKNGLNLVVDAKHPFDSGNIITPVHFKREVCYSSVFVSIGCLSKDKGHIIWSYSTNTPAGVFYVGEQDNARSPILGAIIDQGRQLQLINAYTGSIELQISPEAVDARFISAGFVQLSTKQGLILVADELGLVYSFDDQGKYFTSLNLPEKIVRFVSLANSNGAILALGESQTIYHLQINP